MFKKKIFFENSFDNNMFQQKIIDCGVGLLVINFYTILVTVAFQMASSNIINKKL
jgi:hypothetical protein